MLEHCNATANSYNIIKEPSGMQDSLDQINNAKIINKLHLLSSWPMRDSLMALSSLPFKVIYSLQ